MRLRDESLRTGKALAWIDPEGRFISRVLIFLVRGAQDIEPLTNIEFACRSRISERNYQGFSWHAVADPGQISAVDPRFSSADIARFEACEFSNLNSKKIAALLHPVVDLVVAGDRELLPRTGGAVGSPAEGIQFLNRKAEIENLISSIQKGKSLALYAPRRMGKTSLMRMLERRLRETYEYSAYALNLERDPSIAECAARLRSMLSGEAFQVALRTARKSPASALAETVAALSQGQGKPLVIFIDELVTLFEAISLKKDKEVSRKEILLFLESLGVPLEKQSARLVVAGSVNWLEYLNSEFGLQQSDLPGLFSKLERTPVRALDFQEPESELRRLLLGSQIVVDDGDMNWLSSHLDLALPFPAIRFLDQLVIDVRRNGTVDLDRLDQLFRQFLSETDAFADYDEHLSRRIPISEGVDIVAEVLAAIASGSFEEGSSRRNVDAILQKAGDDGAERLRTWLFDTFPLKEDDNQVRFSSRLFRLWWLSQVGTEDTND